MSSTIKPSEAKKRKPDFFENRPKDCNWVLTVKAPDATHVFTGVEWEAVSRFGAVRDVVVTNEEGKPLFNRPEYREAPNINTVAWGFDPYTGEVKIGIVHEARPHADDPSDPESTRMMVFAQTPIGFADKIVGKDESKRFENADEAAVREVGEETGASAVIDITKPIYPAHNPNPTFVATWSEIRFVQIDLLQVRELKTERDELIYKAEYIEVPELLRRLAVGEHEGIVYRSALINSLLMIFFATHPEFFKAS